MTLIESIQVWELRNEGRHWFDDFTLDSRIKRDYLYKQILSEYRDIKTVYSDSELFHDTVKAFFIMESDTITRLLDTYELEYNPIENYNKTTTVDRDLTGKIDYTQGDEAHDRREEEDDHYVSAFNNPTGDSVLQTKDTSVETDENSYNSTRKTDSKNTEDVKQHETGITSSSYQELIDKQRKTVQFNIVKWILTEFCRHLLVGLW